MSDVPRHAFEVEIHVGGCDWERVLAEVDRFARHLRKHGPECSLSSGGAGTAGHIHIEHRDVTEEQFEAELLEWSKSRRIPPRPRR